MLQKIIKSTNTFTVCCMKKSFSSNNICRKIFFFFNVSTKLVKIPRNAFIIYLDKALLNYKLD